MITIKRKDMIFKILLFIFVTLILTIVFAVIQQKIGLNFEKISLPQLAPAMAVLVLYLVYKELPAAITLHADKRILIKSVLALLIPAILFSLTFLVGKQVKLSISLTDNIPSLLPAMLTGMIIGALGEELGWRSYLQPLLQQKNSLLISSVIVGVVWGLWHIGHYKNGLVFMTGFLLFTISASMIIAWLFQGTGNSLLISALFHVSVNICFFVFFKNAMTDSKYMLINGIVWLIPALLLLIFSGKDLIKS